MKNAKFIKTALIVGSLVAATSAFADMPSTISSAGITTGAISHVSSSTLTDGTSKSQLSAFAGVPTAAVSQNEMQMAGEGIRLPILPIKPSPSLCKIFPFVLVCNPRPHRPW
jgi:hypothetical protein